jgi:hypothetical protein
VKEYEERVNKIIHTIVLNDEGVSDIEGNRNVILKSITGNLPVVSSKRDSNKLKQMETGLSPAFKKRKINKARLISQYSSIITKKVKIMLKH